MSEAHEALAPRKMPLAVVGWIWAAGSVALLAPALLVAFGLVSWLPRLVLPQLWMDHGLELATTIVTWGAIGMLGAAGLARLLLGRVVILHRPPLLAAAAGLAIAAALQVALDSWAVNKFGYFEPEIMGPTVMLPFGLAALAVALFGVAVAPSGADLPPRISVIGGGLAALMAAVLNVPGAADGIAASAVPLAVVLTIVSGYVPTVWWIAVRR